VITFQRSRWLVAVAAASGAAILLGGCGGSADTTTSAQPAQPGSSAKAVPTEHPARHASETGSAKSQKRAFSQSKHQSPKKSLQAAKPPSAAGSSPASTAKTADAVAEIKELVSGSGSGKKRTVTTPKQIHKVLQELSESSGDHASGGAESGGGNSPSGVDEILEALGGD
jgi:hypothetical protein